MQPYNRSNIYLILYKVFSVAEILNIIRDSFPNYLVLVIGFISSGISHKDFLLNLSNKMYNNFILRILAFYNLKSSIIRFKISGGFIINIRFFFRYYILFYIGELPFPRISLRTRIASHLLIK